MTDSSHNGPMATAKIDGALVKRLREEKGLTQLYLATAIQVTTDTISRWENKRYQTIKRDNALRLAEALEVPLETIIENQSKESTDAPVRHQATLPDEKAAIPIRHPSPPISRKLIYIAAFVFTSVGLVSYALLSRQPQLTASRVMAGHTLPGHTFPVAIKVTGDDSSRGALILKEQPPAGTELIASQPVQTGSSEKTSMITWLDKHHGGTHYFYSIDIPENLTVTTLTFSGTLASNIGDDNPQEVTGMVAVNIGVHHWADRDKNNRISDKEILMAFDRFGEFNTFSHEMDLVEEIWLGSGYSWNSQDKKLTILP